MGTAMPEVPPGFSSARASVVTGDSASFSCLRKSGIACTADRCSVQADFALLFYGSTQPVYKDSWVDPDALVCSWAQHVPRTPTPSDMFGFDMAGGTMGVPSLWEFQSCWTFAVCHVPSPRIQVMGVFSLHPHSIAVTGASNMCIGDAGAQALFTCFGHHDTGVPSALTALRSILEFSGAKPLLGVLIFLVFLRELCRALKNHIGSSGVVACNVFDVSPATYDISSVCWILPWKIVLQRLVAHPLVNTLHSTILQCPNPCVVFWRCACFLCLVGSLASHGVDVSSGILFFESAGHCAGMLLLCALLRLLCAPLRAPWQRLRPFLRALPLCRVAAFMCNAGLHLPLEPLARVASSQGLLNAHNHQARRRHTPHSLQQPPQHQTRKAELRVHYVLRCIWLFFSPFLGLAQSVPTACGFGQIWSGHVAVWVLVGSPVEASITPSGFASLNSLDPDAFPDSPAFQDEIELEEPPSHLELAEGEWAPGLSPEGAYQLPPYPPNWPPQPIPRPTHPPPTHRRLVKLPIPRPSSPDLSEDQWLGIIVHAPYFQPRSWGINLRHVQDINDVMDALLRQGSELFDEGLDAIAPITPPRHDVFATFIAYPRCLGQVGGCQCIATMVDATRVGGRYYATVLPQTLSLGAFMAYIQPQVTHEPDQLLVYFGRHEGPASDQEPMHLEDGDAITVLTQACRPPTPFDVRSLLESNASRGKLEHVPMQDSTPGYCLIRNSERWYLHKRYHSSRTPAQAASLYLEQDLSELTLCSSGDFPDLDMMGEPCTAIIAATNLPPGSATEAGAAERLDVFTFLDFRPIGYKPHVHFSHSFQLHVPTLLHLYGIRVAPDFGLSIDGGVVHRDFVVVPQVATLRFRAFPLSERRRIEHPSSSDPGDMVVPTSAQLAAPTEPSSGDPTLSSGDTLLNQTRQERSRSRGRSPTHSSGNHLARKCPQAVQQWQHRDKQPSCPCPVRPLHVQLSRMPPVYSVPALPEFVDLHKTCKITDPPDLTVRLDGAVHITHEEHLRALFLPFGVGNPVHGAPPEVMMQEQEQEGPRDFAQALFLILTPHFTPDIIVIPLAVPSSVPEVFSELEEVREADRARRFTWLTPAQPQLADAFGTIVAVPEWTEEVVAVFDLRTIANTTFAACVPHHATREELLAISGLGAQYPADVYVHIQQDALLPGQQVALWTGVTIAMADPGEALTVGRPLEEMLQSSEGWDPAAEVPGQDDPAFLLLTDEGHARFPLHEARRAQTRTDIADLLGYDMPRMTLRGVRMEM